MCNLLGSWSHRSRLIAKRWVCVIVYGVLGAFGALVLSLLLAPVLAGLSSGLAAMGIAGHVVIAALTLFLVGYLTVKLSLFRPAYLKNLSIHPPLLVSVVIGVCILMVMQGYLPCAYAGLTAFIIFTMCLVMGLGPRVKPCSLSELSEGDIQGFRQDTSKWDVAEITQWTKDELPISGNKKATQLLFGHEKHVQRIFNRLIATVDSDNPPRRTPKSLALIGPFGSGKTSIINALKEIMRENAPNWIVCKVDAWARSPADIDEQILDLVLDSISEFTDVAGLRRLPSNYHAALQSQRGWLAFFSHLASGDSSTENKLKKIDDILLVLDKSLLIVIEDPDRGGVKNKDGRMERMLSLIDRLQQFTSDRIKVIVSGGQELLGDDHRVFEYTEAITARTSDFLEILNIMVDKLWLAEPHDLVLPFGKPQFTMNDFPFGSPRDFKFTLRDVNSLWAKPGELRGGVDLKQLILITFAKHRAPRSVDFLKGFLAEMRFNTLKRSHYQWSLIENVYTLEIFEKHIDDFVSSKQVYEQLNATEVLIAKYLVLALNDRFEGGRRANTQSVLCVGRRNYLSVITNCDPLQVDSQDVDVSSLKPNEKLKDQEYLRAMESIFKELKNESLKPNLVSEDIKKIVLAGPLSPYLYQKMRAEGIGSQAWIELANAIIGEASTIEYSENDHGHPAAAHLIEILNHVLNVDEMEEAETLMSKVIDSIPSLAITILVKRDLSQGREVDKYLSDKSEEWPTQRGLINGLGILTDRNRSKPSDGIWFLYQELQERWLNSGQAQESLLLEWIMENGDRSSDELDRDIQALKILKTSQENLKYMAETLPKSVRAPEKTPADRAIFMSHGRDAPRQTRERWVEAIARDISALTEKCEKAEAEPSG